MLRRHLMTVFDEPDDAMQQHDGAAIAKDRASLLPDMAATLIFLQDAWELADEYFARHMRRG